MISWTEFWIFKSFYISGKQVCSWSWSHRRWQKQQRLSSHSEENMKTKTQLVNDNDDDISTSDNDQSRLTQETQSLCSSVARFCSSQISVFSSSSFSTTSCSKAVLVIVFVLAFAANIQHSGKKQKSKFNSKISLIYRYHKCLSNLFNFVK